MSFTKRRVHCTGYTWILSRSSKVKKQWSYTNQGNIEGWNIEGWKRNEITVLVWLIHRYLWITESSFATQNSSMISGVISTLMVGSSNQNFVFKQMDYGMDTWIQEAPTRTLLSNKWFKEWMREYKKQQPELVFSNKRIKEWMREYNVNLIKPNKRYHIT